MGYGSVLDQGERGLAVGGQLELVAQFEDEELLGVAVAVEVLPEGAAEVAVGLVDWLGEGVLRR